MCPISGAIEALIPNNVDYDKLKSHDGKYSQK